MMRSVKIGLFLLFCGFFVPISAQADEDIVPEWHEIWVGAWEDIQQADTTDELREKIKQCYRHEMERIYQENTSTRADDHQHMRKTILSSVRLKSCYVEDLYYEDKIEFLQMKKPFMRDPYTAAIPTFLGTPVRTRLLLYRSLLFPSLKEQYYVVHEVYQAALE
ncbi:MULTISPECIES: hypothetical protein [unclassified Saccharibacter]|uniref:hypothetical protein n=1 Tax=unclassified Saccharibacter TaxID=2648722 RepID=UPI001328F112|nr:MULTISPECIES: hypothetical protein [unclassified Saccharibacter]MXV36815.1 hypothetical protein [Saccharibacter sp. EH611]MXV58695.1 hypothetical protein [Saccharibacter sp. EH70]MXV66201.1 hypothetical protein [Saccharibacter sp. EH60]